MSWIDWALLTVLLVSALVGLWRGLVYEVLSVAGWVLAFVLAQAWAEPAGMLLPMDGAAAPLRLAAGFAVVFIAVAFAAGLLSWLIKKMVESVGLRPVDRVLGGVFGVVRGLVILLGLTLVMSMLPPTAQAGWRASPVAQTLNASLHTLKPLLPDAVSRHLP
ncbi:CvpA family protein [Hydrogenophaga sp.]|jgi:membrane protein required for colicin V production|uniref:CvpA family protein n=1 Tax=Hydrogenophaga sp. TaxID=1904254 RepID=UPI00260A8616|nr:CvpA family protein [Hydrogenophaga sp.]MDM7950116.1 CvpA family protein [Hydrogenophaga sp.]